MSKSKDVGRSWRTHAKHELMNSFVGQEVGSAGRLPDVHRLTWIDLTAGDAALVDADKWERSCSPGILAAHAARSKKPVLILLHEIQPGTFDRLVGNLEEHLPDFGYARRGESSWHIGDRVKLHAINGSGMRAATDFIGRGDAALVLNDPNAITEWAMRETFAQEIKSRTWTFRSLSTLGCNTAGLKRLPAETRLNWFDLIASQERALPAWRDLLLAAIERDEAQWAYLLSTPEKWHGSTESTVRTAFQRAFRLLPEASRGRTAAMTWLRTNPSGFQEAKLQLILRKDELARIRDHEDKWLAATREERLEWLDADDGNEPEEPDELTLF